MGTSCSIWTRKSLRTVIVVPPQSTQCDPSNVVFDVVLLSSHGFRQGLNVVPAAPYPSHIRCLMEAQPTKPISNAQRFPIDRNKMVCTHIAGLFTGRSPMAIFGRVVSVVVNAVDGAIFGTNIHVFQKITKIVPACAYANATTTVVLKSRRVGVFATLNHSCP